MVAGPSRSVPLGRLGGPVGEGLDEKLVPGDGVHRLGRADLDDGHGIWRSYLRRSEADEVAVGVVGHCRPLSCIKAWSVVLAVQWVGETTKPPSRSLGANAK